MTRTGRSDRRRGPRRSNRDDRTRTRPTDDARRPRGGHALARRSPSTRSSAAPTSGPASGICRRRRGARGSAAGTDRRRDRPGLGGQPHLADLRPSSSFGPPSRPRSPRSCRPCSCRSVWPRSGSSCAVRPSPSARSRANLTGRRAAGAVFAISSVVTPFFLGAAVGGDRVRPGPDGRRRRRPVGSWLNPTSILVGLLAVSICAYLAAVFLVADARRRSETRLAAYFLRRATLAGDRHRRPCDRRTRRPALRRAGRSSTSLSGRGWPFVVGSVVLGLAALLLLRRQALMFTRALAIGAVVAIVWGWGAAQYPDILPGSMSLAAAAAPEGSLRGPARDLRRRGAC